MKEKLEQIKENSLKKINECKSILELQEVMKELTGKKSELTEVLKSLSGMDVDTKKQVGMKANEIKNFFDVALKNREEERIDICIINKNYTFICFCYMKIYVIIFEI